MWGLRIISGPVIYHLPGNPLRNTGSEFLFMATFALDMTFLAPLTSEILTVSPNWGSRALIRGHRWCTVGYYGYGFLLIINCTRGRILHRFRNIPPLLHVCSVLKGHIRDWQRERATNWSTGAILFQLVWNASVKYETLPSCFVTFTHCNSAWHSQRM